MILCVNANPAIDKTVVVSPFRLNEIHRPQEQLALPGGKGANVARALRRLGETPIVTGWIGGFAGRFIEAELWREGIETAFVETDGEARTCLSILDPAGDTLTEIYERGQPVSEEQVELFRRLFRARVWRCQAVTLSGSLPPGVPENFYAELLAIARDAGVPALLDSSGPALRAGLTGGWPLLIKPNTYEFAELIGTWLESTAEIAAAAARLAARHETIVAVSLGADGVIVAGRGEIVQARPPRVAVRSAVGSGDCTLAGIAYGLTRGYSLQESLRYGVAAGTANALALGAGVFSREDFERVLSLVTASNFNEEDDDD